MNNTLVTFLFLIITISMALGILAYYSSSASIIEAKTNPLYIAESYSKALEVSSTQPVISYIIPQSKPQSLNFTVNSIVTVNLPGYTGKLYLIPFLMPSTYNPYTYVPTSIPNQVAHPTYVGYVSIKGGDTQLKPFLFNGQVNFLTQQGIKIEAYAFTVCNGQTLNVTFVTSLNETPVIWILANIDGQMYRLAYPYFVSLSEGVNTVNGIVTAQPITYCQLYEKCLSHIAVMFAGSNENMHACISGNSCVNLNGRALGVFGQSGYFEVKDAANCLKNVEEILMSPNIEKEIHYNPNCKNKICVKCTNYVPPCPCIFVNPIYQYYNPYACQVKLEKEINSYSFLTCNAPGTNSILPTNVKYCVANSTLIVCKPLEFTQRALCIDNNYISRVNILNVKCILFKYPVVFEKGFKDISGVNLRFCNLVVSEGCSVVSGIANIHFEKGALFNYSTSSPADELIFCGTNCKQECDIHVVSCGPFIVNFTNPRCIPTEVKLTGVNLQDKNYIISFTAKYVDLAGVDTICSCYPLFIQAPAHNTINFCRVTINGGLILNSGYGTHITFQGGNCLNVKKGPLIIDTGSGSYITMNGNSLINTCGYALIKAQNINLNGGAEIRASKYALFYANCVSVGGNSKVIVCNTQPPQSELSQIEIYPKVTSSLGVAGWFSVFPNATEVNYLNITLTNGTSTFYTFFNISPINNGECYNITPIVHPAYLKSGGTVHKVCSLIVKQGTDVFYNVYITINECIAKISVCMRADCTSKPVTICAWKCGTTCGYIGVPKGSHLILSLSGEPSYQFLLYEGTQPNAVSLMEDCGSYVKLHLNCQTPVEYFYLVTPCVNYNELKPTYSTINCGYCFLHVTYIC
ncbi:hypothetical protein [Acidianus sp. HS-5]|uniref:hypothetical protein n=1 Tax=Acidianus sp. HS-5 TaxID=2886040 RepID=UPI001F42E8DF|nr:hypothetical protein [Acidianus sp. HS-5]BDC17757.1 hypothetical protein HS5_06470 [Acidianus sp. HS-5]